VLVRVCNEFSTSSGLTDLIKSGATVLEHAKADLYFTGEMTHHQFLAATAQGTSVIVCRHSNTERGYLPFYISHLSKVIDPNQVTFMLSEKDADPVVEM
jgi:putative NIF3 family GTP cyclohydrolase 1 type 2